MLSEHGQINRAGGGDGGRACCPKDILGNIADKNYNFYNTLPLFCTA